MVLRLSDASIITSQILYKSIGVSTIFDNLVDENVPKKTLTDDVLATKDFKFDVNALYTVEVRSHGKAMVSSNWSTPFTVMKLSAPTEIHISSSESNTPILTWEETNSTSVKYNYYYEYFNQDATFDINELDNEENGFTKLFEKVDLSDVTDASFKYIDIKTNMIVRKTPYIIKSSYICFIGTFA